MRHKSCSNCNDNLKLPQQPLIENFSVLASESLVFNTLLFLEFRLRSTKPNKQLAKTI